MLKDAPGNFSMTREATKCADRVIPGPLSGTFARGSFANSGAWGPCIVAMSPRSRRSLETDACPFRVMISAPPAAAVPESPSRRKRMERQCLMRPSYLARLLTVCIISSAVWMVLEFISYALWATIIWIISSMASTFDISR